MQTTIILDPTLKFTPAAKNAINNIKNKSFFRKLPDNNATIKTNNISNIQRNELNVKRGCNK